MGKGFLGALRIVALVARSAVPLEFSLNACSVFVRYAHFE